MTNPTRRDVLKTAAAISIAPASLYARPAVRPRLDVPRHLRDHAELFTTNPRAAAQEWFAAARFGLFMHFGVYSILGRGEWVQFQERIPVAEYAKLQGQFNPKKFDADFITDLALEANMTYVNITARQCPLIKSVDLQYLVHGPYD